MTLGRLAVHYYRPDFTEGAARALIADMVADLEEYAFSEIEVSVSAYRRNGMNRFFPTSGALRDLIAADRRERTAEASRPAGRIVPAGPDGRAYPDRKSRPLMWWTKPRSLWHPDWREQDAPDGSMVRDPESLNYRPAHRFS